MPEADVAVVAGDVGEGLVRSVRWAAETLRPHMRTVLVAGNHEYYGGDIAAEIAAGREAARQGGVDLLQHDTVAINGTLFSGCTLWTDYLLDGVERRRAAMAAAQAFLRDHRRIRFGTGPGSNRRFRPEDAQTLHVASLLFLDAALTAAPATPDRPHVVVTHHAPSPRSLHPAFAGSALNAAFASDLDSLVLRTRPSAWFHGHVHHRHDFRLGMTRVVANPLGYPHEQTGFDPALVVEI